MKGIILFLVTIPNRIYNWTVLRYRNVIFAAYPKINGKLYIRGRGKTFFGKGVTINSGKSSNPIGGDTRMVIKVFPNAVLTIGDYRNF